MSKTNKNGILYGQEARANVLLGIEEVYKVVSTSLGPRGNNVIIDKGYETKVTHDGYEISKSVILDDKYKKVGADIVLQAAKKQVDEVGDGTTLVTVLSRNIAVEANKLVAAGVNAMSLRAGLEKLRDEVIEKIRKISIPVTTLKQKVQVATVSSANKEIGELVGKVIDDIGPDGISLIEESNGRETEVEMQEGIQLDKGWASNMFRTSDKEEIAVLEGARVLITDMDLSDFDEFKPFFQNEFLKNSKTLFVIAKDYSGNVLPSFIINKMNGKMNVLCVKAPLFEDKQGALLADLAIMTGSTLITQDAGIKLQDIKFEHLGYAEKIVADKDTTIITGGKGDKKKIKQRIEFIRNLIKEEVSTYEVARLKERLAKLIGKVAVIKVGGATEIEMGERKMRVEDAVEATKTAVRDGIVPGGEITLMGIAMQLRHPKYIFSNKKIKAKDLDDPTRDIIVENIESIHRIDDQVEDDNALRIMTNALEAPFRKLLSNAGMDAGEYKERLKREPMNTGVDVTTGEIKDMVKEGIVDPAGVLMSAVYNAVSVATQALTSDAIIPYEPKDEKK